MRLEHADLVDLQPESRWRRVEAFGVDAAEAATPPEQMPPRSATDWPRLRPHDPFHTDTCGGTVPSR